MLGILLFKSSFTAQSNKIGTIQRRLAWPLRKDDQCELEKEKITPMGFFVFIFFALLSYG
jgi:hypothetical protein